MLERPTITRTNFKMRSVSRVGMGRSSSPRPILSLLKPASDDRGDAENVKVIGGHASRGEPLALIATGDESYCARWRTT